MRIKHLRLPDILKIAYLLAVVIVSVVIARSSLIFLHPEISWAVTIDLTVTLPFAYWLFIRKTKISKLTVAGFFILGIIVASFILPQDNRRLLEYLKFFVFPVVELGIFGYAGFLIYKSRNTFKTLNHTDFLENLRETLDKEFPIPSISKVLTFELAGFYYAFLGWRPKREAALFTYHKNNGTLAMLFIAGFIVAAETFALHFLIAEWSIIFAWVLTALSLYFLFQIYAHAKAVFLRQIEIGDEKLFIRCGLLGDAEINLRNIVSIGRVAAGGTLENDMVNLSPIGKFAQPNIKISLDEETALNGVYGSRKNFKSILLSVDEIESFITTVEKKIKGDQRE